MLKINQSIYIKSISDYRHRPHPQYPEFAFAGRSNVGKSSLINCLVNRQNFAKVSKTPGKTRTINYYLINQYFYLVDLPGYGYAKVMKEESKKWQTAIENYLLKNLQLLCLYVLIDTTVGPKQNDLQLLQWLNFKKIYYKLVMTKSDKLRFGQRKIRKSEIQKQLGIVRDQDIILFSAKTSAGRSELLSDMHDHLEKNIAPEEHTI